MTSPANPSRSLARPFTPRRRLRLPAARGVAAVVVLLALAQKAGQLGGQRLARGDVQLVVCRRIDAALELLDVGRRVRVGSDRLAHLLRVLLARLVELRRVELHAEQ